MLALAISFSRITSKSKGKRCKSNLTLTVAINIVEFWASRGLLQFLFFPPSSFFLGEGDGRRRLQTLTAKILCVILYTYSEMLSFPQVLPDLEIRHQCWPSSRKISPVHNALKKPAWDQIPVSFYFSKNTSQNFSANCANGLFKMRSKFDWSLLRQRVGQGFLDEITDDGSKHITNLPLKVICFKIIG